MLKNDLKKRIKILFNEKNRLRIITVLALLAVILIFLSDIIPGSRKSSSDSTSETEPVYQTEDTDRTAEKLEELLSKIKGAGKTYVILSTEGSEEKVYAEDITSEKDGEGTAVKEKYQSKLIVSDRSGTRECIVKKVLSPRFNGALVVCEGGGDPLVRERLIKAVSAALDLPTNKICVEYCN